MIVYKDLISGDEMMTDAFPQNPVVCDGETIEGMFEVCVVCLYSSSFVFFSVRGAPWYEKGEAGMNCVINQDHLV